MEEPGEEPGMEPTAIEQETGNKVILRQKIVLIPSIVLIPLTRTQLIFHVDASDFLRKRIARVLITVYT